MKPLLALLLALTLLTPASAAPLTRAPLPQSKATVLATEFEAVPLTDSECTNLGGAVRQTMAKECSSGKVCRRSDAEGVVHSVCIDAVK